MALRKRWARVPGGLALGPGLGLLAALTVAGCTSSAVSTAAAGSASSAASPAVTQAQASQVFDAYVATAAKAAKTNDKSLALSAVTGVQRQVLGTELGSHPVTDASGGSSSAYRSTLTVTPGPGQETYGTPTFYLPEAGACPRFFVASTTQTVKAAGAATVLGDATVPAGGRVLMLFDQASAGTPWLLASTAELAAGQALPKLARDSAGYIPTVTPAAATLLAKPEFAGALQAAVVDDGPASAAAKSVASGPLTTGMYEGARDHADGLRAPGGDVYQWELEGSSLTTFALGTAGGGALVFYAMSLNETVAVPGVINKADPVQPGPAITVPLALQTILPVGQPAPRTQLQSQELLSFAAVDPPAGNAKLQVIAIGGGLAAASASLGAVVAAREWRSLWAPAADERGFTIPAQPASGLPGLPPRGW